MIGVSLGVPLKRWKWGEMASSKQRAYALTVNKEMYSLNLSQGSSFCGGGGRIIIIIYAAKNTNQLSSSVLVIFKRRDKLRGEYMYLKVMRSFTF
jgi:hypothetical protein